MEFAIFSGNMDTLYEILYNDDHINFIGPTGKPLINNDLPIFLNLYILESSNLINDI